MWWWWWGGGGGVISSWLFFGARVPLAVSFSPLSHCLFVESILVLLSLPFERVVLQSSRERNLRMRRVRRRPHTKQRKRASHHVPPVPSSKEEKEVEAEELFQIPGLGLFALTHERTLGLAWLSTIRLHKQVLLMFTAAAAAHVDSLHLRILWYKECMCFSHKAASKGVRSWFQNA